MYATFAGPSIYFIFLILAIFVGIVLKVLIDLLLLRLAINVPFVRNFLCRIIDIALYDN